MLKRPNFRNKPLAVAEQSAMAADATIRVGRFHSTGQAFDKLQRQLSERWQALSPRDRLALTVLMAFLFVFIGGYGGYSLHSAANKSKTAYNDSVAEYFWLRSQASNINPDASNSVDGQQSADAAIKATLAQSGLNNAEVIASGDSVQLSFSTDSQAIMGRALGNLQQQGWQFNRLNVQQDPGNKQLQVQAMVSK